MTLEAILKSEYMRWTTLCSLPRETADFGWTVKLCFMRDEQSGDEFWVAVLQHVHWDEAKDDDENTLQDIKRFKSVELLNEQAVKESGELPVYRCRDCGVKSTPTVVMAKKSILQRVKGTDPRNDRRGAVLAARARNDG